MESSTQSYEISLSTSRKVKGFLNALLMIVIAVVSFQYLDVSIAEIIVAIPQLVNFFIANFLPPNFSQLPTYVGPVVDTLLFAVVGTYISAVLSFVFGVLMSEQMNPNPVLRGCVRFFISFLRNIPVLVWTSLLIFVFGIGNMVGLLALTVATIGFLARSYAESINEIAGSKLEALHASGASYLQILVHGLIPEFVPAWLNWTLFSFEINIRASAILGMVGAGGLGILIQSNLNLRNFHEATTLMMILVSLVLLIEFAITYLRRKVNQ